MTTKNASATKSCMQLFMWYIWLGETDDWIDDIIIYILNQIHIMRILN